MFYVCEKKNKHILWSVIALFLVIISTILSIVMFLDSKRKREEKELDDYLDSSIQ